MMITQRTAESVYVHLLQTRLAPNGELTDHQAYKAVRRYCKVQGMR